MALEMRRLLYGQNEVHGKADFHEDDELGQDNAIDQDGMQDEDDQCDDEDSDDNSIEYLDYAPPSDLWSFTFYQYLRFANDTVSKSYAAAVTLLASILFLGILQSFVAIAVTRGTLNSEIGMEPVPVNLYADILDKLWTRGMPQLSSSDAERFCGEFDDNYGNTTFSFEKLPLRNWHVGRLDRSKRSTLDNAIFIMAKGTLFDIVRIAVGLLWIVEIAKEFMEIRDFGKAIYSIPRAAVDEDMITLCEDDGSYHIQGLTVCAKVWGLILVVVRIVIALILFFFGTVFIILTSTLMDLILNALSLVFILDIDNVIFFVLASTVQQEFMERVKPVKLEVSRDWGFCNRWFRVRHTFPMSFQCISMWVIAIVGTFVIRGLQIWYATQSFVVVSALCSFLGPNPNNLDLIEGVFPAIGFCESLLKTECELPKQWQDLQCLYGKKKATAIGCASYTEPIGLSWPFWQQTAIDQNFCTIDGKSMSAPLAEVNVLREVKVLRSLCQKIWQTAPAVNITRLRVSVPQFPSPPPVTVGWHVEPFPRMRDTSVTANEFAAPFACPRGPLLEKALGLTQSNDNFMIRKLLFWLGQSQGKPWPAHPESPMMQNALRQCRKRPIVVKSGGTQGSPCASHAECPFGFCSALGMCENSGCDRCRSCNSGVNGTCGKCDLHNCYQKSKVAFNDQLGFVPHMWSQHLDRASFRWFFYNNATRSSTWPSNKNRCRKNVAGACAVCAEQTPAATSTKSVTCIMCGFGFHLTNGHCDTAPVISMGAGYHHTVVLTVDGAAWAGGDNEDGQLGINSTNDQITLRRILFPQRVRAVGAIWDSTFLLADDGSAYGCGDNGNDQLSPHTHQKEYLTVVRMNVPGKVAAFSGGEKHTLMLLEDGSAWAVGGNANGQLGNGSKTRSSHPVKMLVQSPVLAVCGGRHHSILLLKNRSVLATGGNAYGQLGDGSKQDRSQPILMKMQSPVQAVAAGVRHTALLLSDGTVWSTGENRVGQLGTATSPDKNLSTVPVQMALPQGSRVKAVAAGGYHTLMLMDNGQVWGTGGNDHGQLGIGFVSGKVGGKRVAFTGIHKPVEVNLTKPVKAIVAGYLHSVFLMQDGTVMTVGFNLHSQLVRGPGNGRSKNMEVPNPAKIGAFRPLKI